MTLQTSRKDLCSKLPTAFVSFQVLKGSQTNEQVMDTDNAVDYKEGTFIARRKICKVPLQSETLELIWRAFFGAIIHCANNTSFTLIPNPWTFIKDFHKRDCCIHHNVGSVYFLNNRLNLARRNEHYEASRIHTHHHYGAIFVEQLLTSGTPEGWVASNTLSRIFS